MKNLDLTSFYTFVESATEESCRKHLETLRWKGQIVCPHCNGQKKIYRYKDGATYKCSECKKQFSLTKGTIFERTHIPLKKWFLVIYLGFISVAILSLLIYLLAFHNVICQDQWKVFPKENLTFSNAFVNSEDVRKILVDYNQASLTEKIQISNSPLFHILKREGCIVIKEESLSCNCKK